MHSKFNKYIFHVEFEDSFRINCIIIFELSDIILTKGTGEMGSCQMKHHGILM